MIEERVEEMVSIQEIVFKNERFFPLVLSIRTLDGQTLRQLNALVQMILKKTVDYQTHTGHVVLRGPYEDQWVDEIDQAA